MYHNKLGNDTGMGISRSGEVVARWGALSMRQLAAQSRKSINARNIRYQLIASFWRNALYKIHKV